MAEVPQTARQTSFFQQYKLPILSGLLFIIAGATLWFSKPAVKTTTTSPTPAVKQASAHDSLTYSGEEGVDALTLLKQHATIEQDRSGLVDSINGRKADASKKEYWSFFVNNKMAQVGPADYVTHKGDMIMWKIQIY
ncbi:MAG TPA: DUF4430 domain-containing protein [Patescibacteria group bacterium]|nr:DUF4430 domain-containing protein [Patescibacteria group bacterium]